MRVSVVSTGVAAVEAQLNNTSGTRRNAFRFTRPIRIVFPNKTDYISLGKKTN